jgi:uncharacterized membrane protein YecN with MAPEG domain
MKKEQKIVAAGAVSGVAAMALGVWLLTGVLPPPLLDDALAERLAYALGANVVALLPFFVMIITVANARFLSEAIDPTRHAESRTMEIDGRVVDNTLQQNFVFAVASLALSTLVALEHLQVVWACAIVFVVARVVFWLGYRIDPLYRAPGMAATGYLNLGMILFVLYGIVKGQ